MDQEHHWNAVYSEKSEDTVSWYQPDAQPSLDLIAKHSAAAARGVVDIGAGASRLVDGLLAQGIGDVTLLDLSDAAFAVVRRRLGDKAEIPRYVSADVTEWAPERSFGVWHDRAAFHFLTERQAQDAYLAVLASATLPGSMIVMATFALDGPERCSGLAVQRYSPASLADRLGPSFALQESLTLAHATPGGATQRFQYSVFARR